MEKPAGGRSVRPETATSSSSRTLSGTKKKAKKRASNTSVSSRRAELHEANVVRLNGFPEWTDELRAESERVAAMRDEDIDLSDIPETDFSGPVYIGLIPGPGKKKSVTIRLDADMVEWFKAQGKGWQTKMNWALRLYFTSHRKTGAKWGAP